MLQIGIGGHERISVVCRALVIRPLLSAAYIDSSHCSSVMIASPQTLGQTQPACPMIISTQILVPARLTHAIINGRNVVWTASDSLIAIAIIVIIIHNLYRDENNLEVIFLCHYFCNTYYLVAVETYCFCVWPPSPLLRLFKNICGLHIGPGEFAGNLFYVFSKISPKILCNLMSLSRACTASYLV